MGSDLLDLEKPFEGLLKSIESLEGKRNSRKVTEELESLRAELATKRAEIFGSLTPWQRVEVARHPQRPRTLEYVERLFSDFTEIHGDRRFGDDAAIVAGFAVFDGDPVLVVGHQKGRGTKDNIRRNFGYARPEGYRKALRAMKLAEKFSRPILVFIDTPAAYPGVESEERGVAEAIATNLKEMAMLSVPVVVIVTGEGGSGGALGIAIGDSILMQEFSMYSVIPPEGCAAILWRDADKKREATEALKIQAEDLRELGVVDSVIGEPVGGAHADPEAAAELIARALRETLEQLGGLSVSERLESRYQKFRAMGRAGFHEVLFDSGEPGPESTNA
tara:strand:+ start:6376 stop:7377 length:1002 start_codon:yes stop_codon:yes gene_type:complete